MGRRFSKGFRGIGALSRVFHPTTGVSLPTVTISRSLECFQIGNHGRELEEATKGGRRVTKVTWEMGT